jgi:predicted Zn-dependent protease
LKIRFALILIAAGLLLLAGCAGVSTPPVTQPSTTLPAVLPPSATTATPETPAQQAGGEAIVVEPEPKPVMSGNKAIVALLDRAELDSKAGKREAAGALLERALRIEPRNPWLWLQLAQVRLAQGQYAQAITLARKSNSFGGRQPRLQAENWQVIGQARVAQGDTAGAEQAFKLAAELAQQAKNLKP